MHLGLIGCGSIAKSLIDLLEDTRVRAVTILVRPTASVLDVAQPDDPEGGKPIEFVTSLADLTGKLPDLVVECAGHAAVAEYVPGVLTSGIDVVIASIGALADKDLKSRIDEAQRAGHARLILPSGAIGGLDVLRAIGQGGNIDLCYRGVKPALAWAGTPAEEVVDLASLKEARTIFEGTGRQAALAFPKNANVVAALALAGGDFDRMSVQLVADPEVQTNQHSYDVVSSLCRFSMAIEATPTSGNARTSMTTVLSILQEIETFPMRDKVPQRSGTAS